MNTSFLMLIFIGAAKNARIIINVGPFEDLPSCENIMAQLKIFCIAHPVIGLTMRSDWRFEDNCLHSETNVQKRNQLQAIFKLVALT